MRRYCEVIQRSCRFARQSELRGNRDENSDRRCDRCDRPAVDSSPGANRHEVFALTRSPDALREIGAEAVIVDALDAAAVKAAVGRIRPDAVINELTSLPRHYTPAEMKAAAERDRKVRVEGNVNLLAALRDAGVRRYLLQSSGFWYAPGAGLADESVPFISSAPPGVEASARTYLELEARASATPGTRRIFASSLFGAMQIEHVRPVASRTACFMRAPISRASPGRSVTSM